MEESDEPWPPRSNATTALAGYAITTTTFTLLVHLGLSNQYIVVLAPDDRRRRG